MAMIIDDKAVVCCGNDTDDTAVCYGNDYWW